MNIYLQYILLYIINNLVQPGPFSYHRISMKQEIRNVVPAHNFDMIVRLKGFRKS